jgi:GTP-binding protein
MHILTAEYVISAVEPSQYPEGNRPEIAFAGRSNVGKSSLINKLVNRRSLARISNSPGKTRALNYYNINNGFYFVDLPGYGFAKVSMDIKNQWGKMVEGYLLDRQALKVVVQLVDIRHVPSKEDIQLHDWLKHYQRSTILVLTKADKIARGKWQNHAKTVRQALRPLPVTPVIIFSVVTGQGKDELWGMIGEYL